MSYRPVIGLEIHVQLNTKTKLFCRCLNEYAPDEPNKNICEFCTGQPGALPLLNKAAVQKAMQLGVAVEATIPEKTRWDRKNYFYPDLPAGYQISQYDNPIVVGGHIDFYIEDRETGQFEKSSVLLTRAHLETDAAKLLHAGGKTMVDFNRSGAPLIEIVTEPVIHSAAAAMAFVAELQLLVRRLGISDGDMDKGQMRFDCNVSLQNDEQQANNQLPPYRVETKNINSIRSLGRVIEYEMKRQEKLLESGTIPDQETRGWKDELNKSVTQRSKEDAMDYRYFPEPDLQILEIARNELPELSSLPELPAAQRNRYLALDLSLQVTNTFVTQPEVGNLFDEVIASKVDIAPKTIKTVANIITVNLIGIANKEEKSITDLMSVRNILSLSSLLSEEKINNQGLQKAIDILLQNKDLEAEEIVVTHGLMQLSDDTSLRAFVDVAIEANPEPVAQYKAGKIAVIGFLVGQCMKESKGKGNPAKFKQILEEILS